MSQDASQAHGRQTWTAGCTRGVALIARVPVRSAGRRRLSCRRRLLRVPGRMVDGLAGGIMARRRPQVRRRRPTDPVALQVFCTTCGALGTAADTPPRPSFTSLPGLDRARRLRTGAGETGPEQSEDHLAARSQWSLLAHGYCRLSSLRLGSARSPRNRCGNVPRRREPLSTPERSPPSRSW
jgi:hypothetical protein